MQLHFLDMHTCSVSMRETRDEGSVEEGPCLHGYKGHLSKGVAEVQLGVDVQLVEVLLRVRAAEPAA